MRYRIAIGPSSGQRTLTLRSESLKPFTIDRTGSRDRQLEDHSKPCGVDLFVQSHTDLFKKTLLEREVA